MRPVDPIDYGATESLNSFYLGCYGEDGRLARFVKYLVEREDFGEHRFQEKETPNTTVYFEAVPANASEFTVGKSIDYSGTKGQRSYFKGRVDNSGNRAHIERINRNIFFTDEYTYWPNGELKERVMTKEDGTVVRSRYDQTGREIESGALPMKLPRVPA